MLRPYQQLAVSNVRREWETARSVLLCGPTGSGKTEQGKELAGTFSNPVWLCHRRDLAAQAFARVGSVCKVKSIPALALQRQTDLSVDCIVLDEAHHSTSESWRKVAGLFPYAKMLGLTATPERADGQPLGDMFERIVVAASYSELLAAGYLAPCRVFRPTKEIDRGMACHPVGAYLKYANGKTGFIFVSSLKAAYKLQLEFANEGIDAQVVSGTTSKQDRQRSVELLRDGRVRLIINCGTMVEGVDVPSAEVCILGRRCVHSGIYLQTVGRVLRASPGKLSGVLIDLVGASSRHGLPTEDREYSLAGTAIRQSKATPVRTCYQCGACMEAFHKSCISCSTKFIPGVHRPVKIHDMELREVYNGSETIDSAKQRELVRLTSTKRFSAAAKQFEALFGRRPTQQEWAALPQETIQREYEALKQRFPFTQASAILKSYTGVWNSKWRYTDC